MKDRSQFLTTLYATADVAPIDCRIFDYQHGRIYRRSIPVGAVVKLIEGYPPLTFAIENLDAANKMYIGSDLTTATEVISNGFEIPKRTMFTLFGTSPI